jgi:hypothetical protein
MAYYKVLIKEEFVYEVLVHGKDKSEAQKVVDVCEWGEPISIETKTVSIVELEEKKDE